MRHAHEHNAVFWQVQQKGDHKVFDCVSAYVCVCVLGVGGVSNGGCEGVSLA